MIAALTTAGWSEGDYTIVFKFGDKINVGGLAGVVPHVTINKSSVKAVVTKMLRNRVAGAAAAFKEFMADTYFHVTLAMGDNPFDKDNPRWRSDDGQWDESQYYEVDTTDLQLANVIKAGKKVMGR